MHNILIVGAGAVGQVYGWLLAQGGNKVTFLAKEKYREELEQGLTLYDINRDKRKRHPIRFSDFKIVTDWGNAVASGPRIERRHRHDGVRGCGETIRKRDACPSFALCSGAAEQTFRTDPISATIPDFANRGMVVLGHHAAVLVVFLVPLKLTCPNADIAVVQFSPAKTAKPPHKSH